jgi:hypothetical protein
LNFLGPLYEIKEAICAPKVNFHFSLLHVQQLEFGVGPRPFYERFTALSQQNRKKRVDAAASATSCRLKRFKKPENKGKGRDHAHPLFIAGVFRTDWQLVVDAP